MTWRAQDVVRGNKSVLVFTPPARPGELRDKPVARAFLHAAARAASEAGADFVAVDGADSRDMKNLCIGWGLQSGYRSDCYEATPAALMASTLRSLNEKGWTQD
ncbi:hypothetical protein [Noviherbaspirillum aridicola]|uniref:hypothetical protein n=1 Tax=Noviherbaspirillum aridicola TaxID=2849687 RepID=UPI001C80F52F|nr:hypothetical protein [Noviherbaspirillum aridicola]